MSKDMKNSKKTFTTQETNIKELKEEEYDLSDSDGDSHTYSFFLRTTARGWNLKIINPNRLSSTNYRINKYMHKKLDLSTVVLLDNDSTIDLF